MVPTLQELCIREISNASLVIPKGYKDIISEGVINNITHQLEIDIEKKVRSEYEHCFMLTLPKIINVIFDDVMYSDTVDFLDPSIYISRFPDIPTSLIRCAIRIVRNISFRVHYTIHSELNRFFI
jgi:hypothetical protein